jgi:hypothetical protein
MKLELSCPHASYDHSNMRIRCAKANGNYCAHQRLKPCKGWCVLTDAADKCPARENNDEKRKTNKKHSD